jgi:diguanylate cyclase (GGDEF)-like protein/PAS domain S-box-containing protein
MAETTTQIDKPLVLVADDDPTMRFLIREALEQADFAVKEAEDGAAALAAVKQRRPHIVLLDVLMPGLDGFAVCTELRRQPENAHLPILMVTGLDDTESISRGYAMGATDFVTKPLNWPTLKYHVHYMLRSSHALEVLRQNEMRLANAQRIARLGNWDWDIVSNRLFWSDEIHRIFGIPPGKFGATYETFLKAVHPDEREAVKRMVRRALAGKVDYDIEHRIVRPDGGIRQIHSRAEVSFDKSGRPVRMQGTVHDITERKEAEEKLLLAGKVFEHSSEMIAVTDPQAGIVDVNPAFTKLSGYSREEVLGGKMNLLKSGLHDAEFYRCLWATLLTTGHWHGEIFNRRKDGEILPILSSINAVRNENGENTHYISIATDISKLKEAEERLRYLAYFDPLTGLPNRTLFQDRLQQTAHEARRGKTSMAVLLLDLDNFKDINDTLGHRAGDQALIHIARVLRTCVRQSDTAARMGGDEFAIVMRNVSHSENVIPLAQKILETLAEPFVLEGQEVYVTASIGIALYPADGRGVGDLLKKADTAMYHAKNQGRARYRFFAQDMNAQVQERLALQTSLRQALERDEFMVYYQPKFDIHSREMTGTEALIRWQHPKKGFISPAQFIPVAEETGLIVPMGEKVLRMACAQNKAWQAAGRPAQRVAVNLSARQFLEDDLPGTVHRLLRETGLDPRWLELEITESTLMQKAEGIDNALKKLRAMGIRIALDDFGTGYSSLGYLRRFPIDTLKIDQSFVRDILTDPDAATIVKTIIAMARNLKLKTVAEGVETEGQLAFLREEGCDEAQGYLIAKPLPPEELEPFFASSLRGPVPS